MRFTYKQTWISSATVEPKCEKKIIESIKPSLGSLFEAHDSIYTNALDQKDINWGRKRAMKKHIFDVELSDLPTFYNCNF